MYVAKNKQNKQNKSNSSIHTGKKPLNTNLENISATNFDDVRIHYNQTNLFSQRTNVQNTVQMKLKISTLTEDPEYELTVEELDDIMQQVYYGELESVSEDEVREKITELIQEDNINQFEHDYDLKDYLCDYFSEKTTAGSISDGTIEGIEETQPVYAGKLSDHKRFHRKIKPHIMASVPLRHLQALLGNRTQTNFDFYICYGNQLWVSDNNSKKAEIDTGYDIIVFENGDSIITKRSA